MTGRQINQRGSRGAAATGLQVTTARTRQKIKRFAAAAAASVRTRLNQYDFVVVGGDHRRRRRTDAISSRPVVVVVSGADVPRVSGKDVAMSPATLVPRVQADRGAI